MAHDDNRSVDSKSSPKNLIAKKESQSETFATFCAIIGYDDLRHIAGRLKRGGIMELSWQTRRLLVQYVAAVYMILLFIFWLIRAKLPQQPRKIEAYDDFKEKFTAAANQQILFIPGTTSIIDPEQTVIMSHCMRFLERHSSDLAQRELTLLVSCPFKYGYLQDFLQSRNIRANVDFLAFDTISFLYAAAGAAERQKPSVTFLAGAFGMENLVLGETVSCHGSIHTACSDFSSLPDAVVVANGTVIGEELYALPASESATTADRIFLAVNEALKLITIATILIGSIYLSLP